MDNNNLLAERLKFLMKLKGYTISELATQTDISEDTIKSIRSGKTKNPSINIIASIAEALSCTIENLIGRTNNADNEAELLRKWRSLDAHGRNKVMVLIDQELFKQPSFSHRTHTISCYTPTAYLGNGALFDEQRVEYISVPHNYMKNVEMAFKILSDSFFPDYFPGDMIAIEKRLPLPEETAVYLKDKIVYIRKHVIMNGKVRLIPPYAANNEVELKNIDDYTCIGTVIGVIRHAV